MKKLVVVGLVVVTAVMLFSQFGAAADSKAHSCKHGVDV